MDHNDDVIRGLGWYSANGMIANAQTEVDSDDVATLRQTLQDLHTKCDAHPGSFIWLGLLEPSRDELDAVTDLLKLDELLVEDAANPAQRAKFVVEEDDDVFALLKLLQYLPGTSDVETGQISVFVGSWYALTVRYGHLGDLSPIRARLERSALLREYGPYAVLYAIADDAVDGTLVVVDEVQQDVTEVETEVFASAPPPDIARVIYNLKRENQEVRRAIGPLVAPAHRFVNRQLPTIPEPLHDMFADIGEHILRAWDTAESNDQLLFTLLTASTSLQDFKQNRDMRKISAWAAIGIVPTAVAGIYGMNFHNMPELSFEYGYPAALLLMVTICANLYRLFKKSGWL